LIPGMPPTESDPRPTSFASSTTSPDEAVLGEVRPSAPITLVLANHYALTLSGLCRLFELEEGFEVLATCADADAALDAVRKHGPHIVMLDVELPANGAFAVLRQIRREKLATQAILLASRLDDHQMLDAVRLGARAVVLKEMEPESLIRCVRKVHAGEPWLEQQAVERALGRIMKHEMTIRQMARGLTQRETEIVRLAIKGVPTKEIAARLAVRQGTVKVHLHNIYDKLQVDGRLGLILFARRQGLV
jgi:DNA-binding NarL/FixJ family response regulator